QRRDGTSGGSTAVPLARIRLRRYEIVKTAAKAQFRWVPTHIWIVLCGVIGDSMAFTRNVQLGEEERR
ncbi:MAG: hypothetical protein ACK51N_06570, partial [bacterium]